MQSPAMVGLLLRWVPGLQRVPSRGDMSGKLLEDLYLKLCVLLSKVYKKGIYVVITIDGWKSRAGTKLLRVLLHNIHQTDGSVTTDLRGTVDITGISETGQLVLDVLNNTIDDGKDEGLFSVAGVTTSNSPLPSTTIGVVTGYASPNAYAKKQLSEKYPALITTPCFSHQLNLVMGHILTNPVMKTAAAQCCLMVTFFSRSTKYMGKLQKLMLEMLGKKLTFEKTGVTRWYSHYGMVRRIIELKPALVAFANALVLDAELQATAYGRDVVAVVHDGRFWERASVMRALLQPLVIELGVIERRASNLADVAAPFGRLFSFFNHTKQTSATLLASATGSQGLLLPAATNQSPTFLTNELVTTILTHLQWRYNFYNDTSGLVLAHVLDPTRHLQGLLSKTGDRASKNSVLNALMALGMRFNLPARADGDDYNRKVAVVETTEAAMEYLEDGPGALLQTKICHPASSEHQNEAVARWAACSEYAGTALVEIAKRILAHPAHAAELERVWSTMELINTDTRSRLDMERLKKMSRVAMYEREQAAARKAKIKTYTPGCLYPAEDEVGGNVGDDGMAEGPSTLLECMLDDVELEQPAGRARGHGAAGGRLGEPLEDSLAEHLGEVERDVEEQLHDERQQVEVLPPSCSRPQLPGQATHWSRKR